MFNAMTRHGTTSSNYSLLVRLNIRRCADEKNQAEIAFGNVRQPCFFSRATFVFKNEHGAQLGLSWCPCIHRYLGMKNGCSRDYSSGAVDTK